MFVVNYLSQELTFYENQSAPPRWHSLAILKGVGEGNSINYHIARREPPRAEPADFASPVLAGRAPPVTVDDPVLALALALALVESGRRGRPVPVVPLREQTP